MKDEFVCPIVRHKQDNVHGPNVQHEWVPDLTLTKKGDIICKSAIEKNSIRLWCHGAKEYGGNMLKSLTFYYYFGNGVQQLGSGADWLPLLYCLGKIGQLASQSHS